MFKPDDPLAPLRPHFSEGWHAQALALADTMVASGQITAGDWAQALGQSLKDAEDFAAPDTENTYYEAVVSALEAVTAQRSGISKADMVTRKEAWTRAYHSTPHGQPVHLPLDAEQPTKD